MAPQVAGLEGRGSIGGSSVGIDLPIQRRGGGHSDLMHQGGGCKHKERCDKMRQRSRYAVFICVGP